MKEKGIQQLIDKYLEGMTSPAEERQLAKELQRTDIPKEWQAIRMMLGELTLAEAEYDEILEASRTSQRKKEPFRSPLLWRGWGRLLPAIAALLLVGFFLFVKPTKKQPVIAQMPPKEKQDVPQPAPANVEKEETAEAMPEAHEPKKIRTRPYRHKHTSLSQEARVLISEAREPVSEEPLPTTSEEVEKTIPTQDAPEVSDMYLLAAAQAEDIRSRGERLSKEVAQLMNQ